MPSFNTELKWEKITGTASRQKSKKDEKFFFVPYDFVWFFSVSQFGNLRHRRRSSESDWSKVSDSWRLVSVFRWFEVGCAIWAQMSQIGASQIKAPIGSDFQKYVYSSFMVKMRIDLGSFRLFWFKWVGDNAWGRNLWNLHFWVSKVKKVKFRSAEKMGCECRNVSISQKA